MAEHTNASGADKFSDGISLLRSEYYTDLRDTAQELVEACRSGEIADRESLIERIHEECDGSQWVIYTQRAQVVLLVSDNDSAGPDELGADGFNWKDGMPWSQLAYFAMQADLYEQLDAEELDVNDDSDWAHKGIDEEASTLSRERCVELLTEQGIDCRDDESDETLREAVAANVKDGTIERDAIK